MVDMALLKELLERREQHSYIHASVVQEKQVPSIAEKLVTRGKVWMVPNKSFRWELGNPVTDMAILKEDRVFLYDLKNLTYEKHKSSSRSVRPIMLLLGIGKQGGYVGLLDSFKPVSGVLNDDEYKVTFLPDSSIMKRALSELTITFTLENAFPKEVMWLQTDGTTILTKFTNPSFRAFPEQEIFALPDEGFVKK